MNKLFFRILGMTLLVSFSLMASIGMGFMSHAESMSGHTMEGISAPSSMASSSSCIVNGECIMSALTHLQFYKDMMLAALPVAIFLIASAIFLLAGSKLWRKFLMEFHAPPVLVRAPILREIPVEFSDLPKRHPRLHA